MSQASVPSIGGQKVPPARFVDAVLRIASVVRNGSGLSSGVGEGLSKCTSRFKRLIKMLCRMVPDDPQYIEDLAARVVTTADGGDGGNRGDESDEEGKDSEYGYTTNDFMLDMLLVGVVHCGGPPAENWYYTYVTRFMKLVTHLAVRIPLRSDADTVSIPHSDLSAALAVAAKTPPRNVQKRDFKYPTTTDARQMAEDRRALNEALARVKHPLLGKASAAERNASSRERAARRAASFEETALAGSEDYDELQEIGDQIKDIEDAQHGATETLAMVFGLSKEKMAAVAQHAVHHKEIQDAQQVVDAVRKAGEEELNRRDAKLSATIELTGDVDQLRRELAEAEEKRDRAEFEAEKLKVVASAAQKIADELGIVISPCPVPEHVGAGQSPLPTGPASAVATPTPAAVSAAAAAAAGGAATPGQPGKPSFVVSPVHQPGAGGVQNMLVQAVDEHGRVTNSATFPATPAFLARTPAPSRLRGAAAPPIDEMALMTPRERRDYEEGDASVFLRYQIELDQQREREAVLQEAKRP